MKSVLKALLIGGVILSAAQCGNSGGGSSFDEVVGISAGDGAGEQFTGTFTVLFEVTSDGCASETLIGSPTAGTSDSREVVVKHDDGDISFDKIEVKLRGALNFNSTFDVGGADIADAGGLEGNVLRTARLTGRFDDINSFEGNGEETYSGRVNKAGFNCTFSFRVSGIRKA
ncbi:MAG TPA: hypothetical protein VI895_10220 [Bdellovibrionota bacterium]|nr:hypothetical protein [Bdellovibrionota bacterium]